MTVKIECIIPDQEPFETAQSDDNYVFERDEKGRLVTEVWKEKHIAAFLARTDAYRLVDNGEPGATGVEPTAPKPFDPSTAERRDLLTYLRERKADYHVSMKTEQLRSIATNLPAPEQVAA